MWPRTKCRNVIRVDIGIQAQGVIAGCIVKKIAIRNRMTTGPTKRGSGNVEVTTATVKNARKRLNIKCI